jgi:hypothetical protein
MIATHFEFNDMLIESDTISLEAMSLLFLV